MQAATKATLLNLVEQHITSLVRECAVINRHSKRSGFVSAAANDHDDNGRSSSSSDIDKRNDDDDDDDDGDFGGKKKQQRRNKRLIIHHDDVNLALAWRGSEKLYVSGVPLVDLDQQNSSSTVGGRGGGNGDGATTVTDDDDEIDGNKRKRKKDLISNSPLDRLLRTTTTTNNTTIPTLLASSTVPRIDLNAYLQSELMVRPPSELGMTLHWLAVEGEMPVIPANEVWNAAASGGGNAPDITPALLVDLDDDDDNGYLDDANNNIPSENDDDVRIRELQQRLLSEELQLYYSHITCTISNPNLSSDDFDTLTIFSSIRNEGGHIQELVPFLSRFVVSGLMTRRNLRNTDHCVKLVRLIDAMLDNSNLHLDLHLHQLFIPLGTCVVAKNLSHARDGGGGSNSSSSSAVASASFAPFDNHWSLREEAAKCLVKACNIYGDQYTTMRPRLIKILTQQALRRDRPLATQYGGIVGISLFGPRAIDAFILPLAREYWECWEKELQTLSATIVATSTDITADGDHDFEGARQRTKKRRRKGNTENKEYDLYMCQRALLRAIHIFMQNVSTAEKSKRVDVRAFMDVFGERLIPMQPDVTDYMAAII